MSTFAIVGAGPGLVPGRTEETSSLWREMNRKER